MRPIVHPPFGGDALIEPSRDALSHCVPRPRPDPHLQVLRLHRQQRLLATLLLERTRPLHGLPMTTPCTKCGHTHDPALCQGHVIKDPDTRDPIDPRQCAKTPVKGSTVCRSHGAAKGTPAAAAAERRQLEAAAEATINAMLWPGLRSAEPVKDPVASLERLAGALEQLVDQAGARVSALQHLAGGKDLTSLRAEVTLLERALGHLRPVLVDMARLGIAEREIRLAEGQAQFVVAAVMPVLELVPREQRDAALVLLLDGLGVEHDLLVPGEVVA